jgi:hypothetical protein
VDSVCISHESIVSSWKNVANTREQNGRSSLQTLVMRQLQLPKIAHGATFSRLTPSIEVMVNWGQNDDTLVICSLSIVLLLPYLLVGPTMFHTEIATCQTRRQTLLLGPKLTAKHL